MMLDIKQIYLKMQMKRYEYLHLRLSTLPDDVIKKYKVHEKNNARQLCLRQSL